MCSTTPAKDSLEYLESNFGLWLLLEHTLAWQMAFF